MIDGSDPTQTDPLPPLESPNLPNGMLCHYRVRPLPSRSSKSTEERDEDRG